MPSLTEPSSALLNFLLNVKTFDSCLGQGAFGIVLHATDNYGVTSAIKFLFPADKTDKEQKQILRETRIMDELNSHPNIVKVLDTVEKNFSVEEIEALLPEEGARSALVMGELYKHRDKSMKTILIQMELCGENLRAWLKENKGKYINNPFMQRDQIEIVSNLISGLQFLHKNKIMHRDLKPENVMFSNKGYKLPVKIGDFGLCRKIEADGSLTSSLTSLVGTRSYMAPEIRIGDRDYSYRADIYSLGLIIWEVMQSIEIVKFEKLVYDEEYGLVEEHPLAGEEIGKIIITMTKRKVKDRLSDLGQVLKYMKSFEIQLDKKLVKVGSATQLKSELSRAVRGTTILLCDEVYVGPFHVDTDNVTITGESMESTVFKCEYGNCITFSEDSCSISNISMISGRLNFSLEIRGNGNRVENIAFKNRRGLLLTGNHNTVSNIKFSNGMQGLTICGSNNIIEKIRVENMSNFGICFESCSSRNVLTNVNIFDTKHGIMINGSGNKLSNVSLIKGNQSEKNYRGVHLFPSGVNNVISKLRCTGYLAERDDWGVVINADNSTLRDSSCSPVLILAANSTLNTVDCGQLIVLGVNAVNARLIRCCGTALGMRPGNLDEIDCNFKRYFGLTKIVEY